jgi:hypothetical protein
VSHLAINTYDPTNPYWRQASQIAVKVPYSIESCYKLGMMGYKQEEIEKFAQQGLEEHSPFLAWPDTPGLLELARH